MDTKKMYKGTDVICHECIGEPYLSREIKQKGKRRKCAFCGYTTRTYFLDQLINRIKEVMLAHFKRTPENPSDRQYRLQADKESPYWWYREGQTVEEILVNEFEIVEEAVSYICETLENDYSDMDTHAAGVETEFGSEVHYELKGGSSGRWREEWDDLVKILKSESRFFSSKVTSLLDSIFNDLDRYRTYSDKPILRTVGPESDIKSLYRARVFQSRTKLLEALKHPDALLGPPGYEHAFDGRMNARGISVFYGATSKDVAIAEVRPPVGSRVAVARFDIINEMQLLDIREMVNIRDNVSVFDPDYLNRKERLIFLRQLVETMITPVMPDDEVFDYLPTQVIADYLYPPYEVHI